MQTEAPSTAELNLPAKTKTPQSEEFFCILTLNLTPDGLIHRLLPTPP